MVFVAEPGVCGQRDGCKAFRIHHAQLGRSLEHAQYPGDTRLGSKQGVDKVSTPITQFVAGIQRLLGVDMAHHIQRQNLFAESDKQRCDIAAPIGNQTDINLDRVPQGREPGRRLRPRCFVHDRNHEHEGDRNARKVPGEFFDQVRIEDVHHDAGLQRDLIERDGVREREISGIGKGRQTGDPPAGTRQTLDETLPAERAQHFVSARAYRFEAMPSAPMPFDCSPEYRHPSNQCFFHPARGKVSEAIFFKGSGNSAPTHPLASPR